MPSDNQLSTVLVLVISAFLIWYLTRSCGNEESVEDQQIDRRNMYRERFEPVQENASSYGSFARKQKPNSGQILAPEATNEGERNQGSFNGEEQQTADEYAGLMDAFAPPLSTSTDVNSVDIRNDLQNYDAKDFLPKEQEDSWFDTDMKPEINDDNLINVDRYVIGINTQGQSLKNASYDIRGTVANPKFTVSPWNNSTYEPDYNLKPLC
jgi:hypothetical protein